MIATPQVRVGGTWLSHGSQGWGDLVITNRWPRGCWEMSWSMALDLGERPPYATLGAPVEAYLGLSPIWAGNLAEPDWDAGTMIAVGACRQGEEALCLTAGGETTSTVNTAVDQAIARGAVDWFRPSTLDASPLEATDSTDSLHYLTALLDAWAVENDTNWYVDASRSIKAAANPTEPLWHILPGAQSLGGATETLVGTIIGRYKGPNGRFASVTVGTGTPEIGVLLAKHGRITAARATAIITALHTKLGAQFSWSTGVDVAAEQIVNDGGTPGDPSQVVAGQMVRFLDQRAESGRPTATDVVLGETVWNVSEGTLRLNPVGLVARDLRSAVEAVGGELL